MTTRPAAAAHRPQLDLPGQTHVAEGPNDQTGMYVMHFAFRRDLAAFASSVRATPLGDHETWQALGARWARFADDPAPPPQRRGHPLLAGAARGRRGPWHRGRPRRGARDERRARRHRPARQGVRAGVRRRRRAPVRGAPQRPRHPRHRPARGAGRAPASRGERRAAPGPAGDDDAGVPRGGEGDREVVPGPRHPVHRRLGPVRPARRRPATRCSPWRVPPTASWTRWCGVGSLAPRRAPSGTATVRARADRRQNAIRARWPANHRR